MDIDFTSEQDLLRDSVRRSCERHCGLDEVRKLENDPIGHSTALWTQLPISVCSASRSPRSTAAAA